jgi:hypothetical protein
MFVARPVLGQGDIDSLPVEDGVVEFVARGRLLEARRSIVSAAPAPATTPA